MAAGDDREACRNLCLSTQTLAANMSRFMRTASGARRMIPIVHVKPPRNGGKDAHGGGLGGNVYARHGTSAVLIAVLCSFILPETTFLRPALTHSRVLGAELDASASGQPRMHADYTGTFGWNRCASLVVPYAPRFTLVRSVQRPAKSSRRFQPENRRVWARGRCAHATAPTAGRRGAPSRTLC